ncbi:DUF4296 domain-containing protein [Ichthyenterobacterium magnum]|uniref:Uncharacterized protein DUF4296 n=1 Tax=Ichthyenterobacterium magnum TaxID=1230530 RepID=A0A420DWB3_9FLAO|nr:DUF4296 domain-containing protein [Ichthyenterobacterium magnum]RKE98506.1 uncharacterized protein DUF4296 [Ichthyenterobacterium magnum]
MKYVYCILVLGFLFLGCNKIDKPKKPENLISKDKMVDILFDTFVLNAAKGTQKQVLEKNGILPKSYIFEKYNIDSLQFALSNEYYAYNTEVYQSIINDLSSRIENEKKIYQTQKKIEEKKRDSLAQIKIVKKDSMAAVQKETMKLNPKLLKRKRQKNQKQ